MFWNKNKIEDSTSQLNEKKEKTNTYTERSCWIYLSEKYNEILFVPIGSTSEWSFRELDKVIIKEWPFKIDELQKCINIALDNFEQYATEIENNNDNWFSFKNSKAKTQKSFNSDYIVFELKTDFAREYADGEVERFNVKSSPREWGKDRHYIIGTAHLVDTDIAQLILDINKDCQKLRKNNSA